MDAQSNGVSIAIVPVLILLAVLITVVSVIGWIARYFREMAAERRRLRLEVSKLAHEVEGLRNEEGDLIRTPRKSSE